jgi:hypothetical protein
VDPTAARPDSSRATIDSSDSPIAQMPTLDSNVRFMLNDSNLTIPPYDLENVKMLSKRIYYVADGDEGIDSLDRKSYDSFSLRAKFTYNIIHPEFFHQLCDILPQHPDKANRIYGTLPDILGEYDWSPSQLAFFTNNRDSVAAFMKELSEKEGRVGANFREIIVDCNATGMIPFLIDAARKETKDHDDLTVLMLLMKKNRYSEFTGSSSYRKLYEVERDEYSRYLVFNKANEDLIIQRATNFYNGLDAK